VLQNYLLLQKKILFFIFTEKALKNPKAAGEKNIFNLQMCESKSYF